MKAYISDIHHFSLEDGPGIRSIVFVKGCPLRCRWCSNPETWVAKDGRCLSVDEVFEVVIKDKPFYESSAGGVTLSGGEALLNVDFSLKLLKKLKENKISTAVETCGYVERGTLEKTLNYIDLFLFDFKHFDNEKHKEFTGVGNQKILDNLEFLIAQNMNIVLRCPIILGVNDNKEHFETIAKISNSVKSVEIMPYHNFGEHKYDKLGIEKHSYLVPSKEQVDEWYNMLKICGCKNLRDKR